MCLIVYYCVQLPTQRRCLNQVCKLFVSIRPSILVIIAAGKNISPMCRKRFLLRLALVKKTFSLVCPRIRSIAKRVRQVVQQVKMPTASKSVERLSEELIFSIVAHRTTILNNCSQIADLGGYVIRLIGNYSDIFTNWKKNALRISKESIRNAR
jgi:hypothetical protein